MKHIIYGVCGIGLGHTYRQLPIIDHLAKNHKIALFAYLDSLSFYQKHFENVPTVKVIQVATPFMGGTKDGLDFKAIKNDPRNQQDFFGINMQAFAEAKKFINTPDLALTDYEPTAAQYAYMCNTPLITLDQHSKYLVGHFPETLHGFSNHEDLQRLNMFFPKAEKRIIFSFFDFPIKTKNDPSVIILPPILKQAITSGVRRRLKNKYVCYISTQENFGQKIADIFEVFAHFPEKQFYLYLKTPPSYSPPNVTVHTQGHPSFEKNLLSCEGLICSAGHSLPSEAAYLGVPIYAIPLPTYEQHMNAEMIAKNGLGITTAALSAEGLNTFFNFAARFTPKPTKQTTPQTVSRLIGLV